MAWDWSNWPWRSVSLDDFTAANPLVVAAATRAGVVINERTAFEIAAVRRAVAVLAEGIAQVDLKVYREEIKDGRALRFEDRAHPLYPLLRSRVSPFMTSFRWRQTMMMHMLLTGNAYSLINRAGGQVAELNILLPGSVTVETNAFGEPTYEHRQANGSAVRYGFSDIFHLSAPSWDGVLGMDGVKIAAEVLGLTSSLERTQSNFQRNDQRPAGVLALENGALSEEGRKNLVTQWAEKYGPNGAGGIAVLDQNWKFTPMTVSGRDAQMIEQRVYQTKEVARMFGVSPLRLYEAADTATYASTEQFMQAHVTYDLGPHYTNWQQQIDLQLLPEDNVFAAFDKAALMKGTLADLGEYYAKALGAGGSPAWMEQDEVRIDVGLNPKMTATSSTLSPGAMGLSASEAASEAGSKEEN